MNASDDSSNKTVEDQSETNTGLLKKWLQAIKNIFSSSPRNRDHLLDLLKSATKKEVLSLEALNMIEGVLQVSDMQVRDIMVPRSQIIVVDKDFRLEECLQQMIESGHSRFPVMGDNRDELMGILLAKDLLPFITKREEKINLKELLRPAMVIPESKRLNILLKEFRAKKQHMAIVADEYGGISGLVTIEDVLEQIVGEIEDEFDPEEDTQITKVQRNLYHIQALTQIEDFNKYFKTSFSDEEFDTIGGLILNTIGHLPQKNETIDIDGFHVKVLSADKRRIRLLQMSRINKPD